MLAEGAARAMGAAGGLGLLGVTMLRDFFRSRLPSLPGEEEEGEWEGLAGVG